MGAQIVRRDYTELRAAYAAKDKDAGSARQLGKFTNLSCGYRTSAGKLRSKARVDYDLPMELPEAIHIRETYIRTYPNVPKYWSRQIERVKRLGYAETFAGRRVQVQGNWSGDWAWSLGSTAINYPIQGTGADQKYLALAVLRDYIVKRGIYFAWELHDGLYSYVPTKILDRSIPEMRYLLNNLPYKKAWGFEPPIPLPWDCKASDKSWGQLKEVKV
jgi:DNA polymerase I-like protein with 3'-5' exonuclease and polymerase domains